LISQEKIEEWLREVEERPSSAPILLQFIANRLRDLSARNEELLEENIALRLEKKVEEYEARIANLEYQIELLKRQLGGEAGALALEPPPEMEAVSLLLYNSLGQVLRVPLEAEALEAGRVAGSFATGQLGEARVRLLATDPREEILFVFDSGRTVARPVSEIPAVQGPELDWERGFVEEPRGDEELAALAPVARMSLYEFCLQLSRRGCVKKIKESFFEGYVSSGYIGAGVKSKTDRTFDLVFCGAGDSLVLASREGFLTSLPVERLPLTIEEVFRLGPVDHVVAGFSAGGRGALLALTQNGKALHREMSWLEPSASFKGRGQPLFSKERRAAGVRLVGAAAVDEGDWGAAADSHGRLHVFPVRALLSSGSLDLQGGEAAAFTTFHSPAGGTAGQTQEKGRA